MANLSNTMYPPQMVGTFMPAFVRDGDALVDFNVSQYNDFSQVTMVHLSMVDMLTNSNVLKSPTGVVAFRASAISKTTSGSYRLNVPPNLLRGDDGSSATRYMIDRYYKVQVRFDKNDASGIEFKDGSAADLPQSYIGSASNQLKFSEWSTVCLVRAISRPTLSVHPFDDDEQSGYTGYILGTLPISGRLSFEQSTDTETLQSFSVKVYDQSGDVEFDSGNIYTGDNVSPNSFTYLLDTAQLNGSEHAVTISYVTSNQYEGTSKSYKLSILQETDDESFSPTVTAEVDDYDALVSVHVVNPMSIKGILHVKRASSQTNFKTWETVKTVPLNGPVDVTVEDQTVSSMVWYTYSVQVENSVGGMSQRFTTGRVMPDFHDATFMRDGRQISVRYNFSVSTAKPNVSRTKVDTLGGRYPRFVENANMNYKSFSITGLISSQEDQTKRFMSKEDWFGKAYYNYKDYREVNDVDDYYDFLWEREFREQLVSWLNDGEVKLFRSMTEGSMCVMLTDVSLTPNSTLGRRLYSFSATMYEVDSDTSVDTLKSLGIWDWDGGDMPTGDTVKCERIAQKYQLSDVKGFVDLVSKISSDFEASRAGTYAKRIVTNMSLRDLKIAFDSPPMAYTVNATGEVVDYIEPRKDSDGNIIDKGDTTDGTYVRPGYRIQLNGKDFLIGIDGVFRTPPGVEVESLWLPGIETGKVTATLDYVMLYDEIISDMQEMTGSKVDRTVIGQLCGQFEPGEYIGDKVRRKYEYIDKDKRFIQHMLSWDGIAIDCDPGAVVSLKYEKRGEDREYIVGESGEFHILDGFKSQDICFLGHRLLQIDKSDGRIPMPNEYFLDDTVRDSADAVVSIEDGTVFHTGGGMTVEVTIKGHVISSVKVIENHDTTTLGLKAVKEMPGRFVGGDKVASVDAVSGATDTSECIRKLVADCVSQAGGRNTMLDGTYTASGNGFCGKYTLMRNGAAIPFEMETGRKSGIVSDAVFGLVTYKGNVVESYYQV